MNNQETTVKNYGNGIYGIEQGMVRAFLIVGKEKALLLDTGFYKFNIESYIKNITDLPIIVVLTHNDVDHIGNIEKFKEIYTYECDTKNFVLNKLYNEISFKYLVDDQIIDIGDRLLKVITTPGHTKGSICILDIKNKVLFSGDTVSYGPVVLFGEGRNKELYLSSLEKLKEMRNNNLFNQVYCCHNECPISPENIDDLIISTKNIIEGSIEYKEVNIPGTNQKAYILVNNRSIILF